MLRNDIFNLLNNPNPKIAEIGVEYGGFTDIYYKENYDIYLIDMWTSEGNDYYFSNRPGQVENGYNQILNKYGDKKNVKIIKNKSVESSLLFNNETFDLIYIDADHSFESVKQDIISWLPKLKSNGIISGHDFDPDINDENYLKYGVEKAVKEIFGSNFRLTSESNYKSWYVIR